MRIMIQTQTPCKRAGSIPKPRRTHRPPHGCFQHLLEGRPRFGRAEVPQAKAGVDSTNAMRNIDDDDYDDDNNDDDGDYFDKQ